MLNIKTLIRHLNQYIYLIRFPQVRVGNTWGEMTSGYPKVETSGQSTSYTFRFAKSGSDDFFYDPAVQYGAGMRSAGNTVIVMLLATLLSVFIML